VFGRRLAVLLLAAAFCAAAALLRFEFWGPFRLILPVQSPVNAESIIGLAFVLAVLLHGHRHCLTRCPNFTGPHVVWLGCVGTAAFLPFLITVNEPFVHDSYAHVARAGTEGWQQVLAFFAHPSGGDRFFRPLGYVTYWLDFKWAGYRPLDWHLWSVMAHVFNCCLVYGLAIKLGFARFPAAISALVFALHGTRAGPVSWVAARFDLLACFFVLLALVSAMEYGQTSKRRWYLAMILFAVLAVLSKESAFCLPLLTLGIIPFRLPVERRRLLRAALGLFIACGIVFVYRWWVLEGVGGYKGATGQSAFAHFNFIGMVKPMLFRQWALLFFPINWSSNLSVWTKAAVVLFLAIMAAFWTWSKPSLQRMSAAILFLFLAEVPVQHLLLMTADLAGSRVLYLPLIGMALFWAVLVEGCQWKGVQIAVSTGLLLFQFSALIHNLLTWREVAFLAQRTCRAAAEQIGADERPVVVRGLPQTLHGVFFLHNGFSECVHMNAQHPLRASIYVDGEQPPQGNVRTFEWNNRTEELQLK
jgi:hypothetical protein